MDKTGYRKVWGNEELPEKKLEPNYRKVKKKREEMGCDYLNIRRMGAATFYTRSCGNMK